MIKFLKLIIYLLFITSCHHISYVEKTNKIVVAKQLLQKNRDIKEQYKFTWHKREYIGFPNVYSPMIFPGAKNQSDLPLKEGETFLEIGSGTGIFSIDAALRGTKKVVAIDINPDAVANTLENARLHKVSNNVTVLLGNMFQPLSKNDKFDVIFFNIPFCHKDNKNLDMLAQSLFDPNHDLLYRYLKEGQKYLTQNGRLLLGYSTTHGNVPLMHKWAKELSLDVKLLSKEGDENKDFITIELYEFKKNSMPNEFVKLSKIDPTIIVKMKYATKSNFIGRPVNGYNSEKCILTKKAADALHKAQIYFNEKGYALKVWDCYRPQRAVDDFFAWSKDTNISTKNKYFPNLEKNMLFELGYIAKKSGHSRGSTVDITLVSLKDNQQKIDMGTLFDLFDEKSHTINTSLPKQILENREVLKVGMEIAGFKNYEKEWWHYTLKDEPFPNTYFDFEII